MAVSARAHRTSAPYAACSAGLVRALLAVATMTAETEHEHDKGPSGSLHATEGALPPLAQQVKRADDQLITYVRARPLVALGAALGLGYVVGRVFSRMSR